MRINERDNTCLICGNINDKVGAYGDFRALKCIQCGLISTDHLPTSEELTKFYSGRYYRNYYDGLGYEKAYVKFLHKSFLRKIRIIKKFADTDQTRILEVGCGPGYFIKAMKEAGFINVTGYEISDDAILEASEMGISLQKKDIISEKESGIKFDVVISWATLEHTTNPVNYFRALMAHLHPGGYLLIDTGIADTFLDGLFRGLSPWFYPPEHLYVFTERALFQLADDYRNKRIIMNPQFSSFQRVLRALFLFKKLILNRNSNPVQDIGLLIVKNE